MAEIKVLIPGTWMKIQDNSQNRDGFSNVPIIKLGSSLTGLHPLGSCRWDPGVHRGDGANHCKAGAGEMSAPRTWIETKAEGSNVGSAEVWNMDVSKSCFLWSPTCDEQDLHPTCDGPTAKVFIAPCVFYILTIINQYDDRLQAKQRAAKMEKDKIAAV